MEWKYPFIPLPKTKCTMHPISNHMSNILIWDNPNSNKFSPYNNPSLLWITSPPNTLYLKPLHTEKFENNKHRNYNIFTKLTNYFKTKFQNGYKASVTSSWCTVVLRQAGRMGTLLLQKNKHFLYSESFQSHQLQFCEVVLEMIINFCQ